MYLISSIEDGKIDSNVTAEMKTQISKIIINFLMKGYSKSQDEFLYCKVSSLINYFLADQYAHILLFNLLGCSFQCSKLTNFPNTKVTIKINRSIRIIKYNDNT